MKKIFAVTALVGLTLVAVYLSNSGADAVPDYTTRTGQACTVCHTADLSGLTDIGEAFEAIPFHRTDPAGAWGLVASSPSPTPSTFGDVDCSEAVDSVDALMVLRHVAGLSVNQTGACPAIGSGTTSLFGDVDCDGDVESVDALKILRYVAGLSVEQGPGCPAIG